jgi:hypothetical protein
MFRQLLPNKNKTATVQHSTAQCIRDHQIGDLNKAQIHTVMRKNIGICWLPRWQTKRVYEWQVGNEMHHAAQSQHVCGVPAFGV